MIEQRDPTGAAASASKGSSSRSPPRRGEQAHERAAHQGLVLGDQDADHLAGTHAVEAGVIDPA
jgi:hypothetical protein